MLRTHCQTSGWSLTEQDPYNNVVRTTVEAMASVFGGTQSLHTNSFDEAIALPTEFSARIARNTQLILQKKPALPKSSIPGGSYMMESLTRDLADRARALIQKSKTRAAWPRPLMPVYPNCALKICDAQTSPNRSRRRRHCGVNKYKLETEDEVDVLQIDNEAVRDAQIAQLNKLRAERDEAKVQQALATITDIAGGAEATYCSRD